MTNNFFMKLFQVSYVYKEGIRHLIPDLLLREPAVVARGGVTSKKLALPFSPLFIAFPPINSYFNQEFI